MSTDLLARHRDRLDAAVAACASREFYSAFDESPSPRVYGETAGTKGKEAYDGWLGRDFPLRTPGSDGTVATERSPYGFELGVPPDGLPPDVGEVDFPPEPPDRPSSRCLCLRPGRLSRFGRSSESSATTGGGMMNTPVRYPRSIAITSATYSSEAL